jgi:hypothetical protein
MVNYMSKKQELYIGLQKYLSPKTQETMWQSLSPFQIFLGVDSVQRLITG